MSEQLDILCGGLNVVDVLFRKPSNTIEGEKHEVNDLIVQGGAPAGNAACVLAALGAKAGFWAYFGNNALSAVARDELARWGVSDSFFLEDEQATPGFSVVEIDETSGERTVYYNLNHYRWTSEADVPSDLGKKTKMVLLDGYDIQGNLPMLRAATEQGCLSVLDLESGDPELLREILSLGTDAVLPLVGARTITGLDEPEVILRKLREDYSTQVVITDGKRGCWALDEDGQLIHVGIVDMEVVDTTGCGDSYHGAYAFARLQNWPLRARMEFATLIAGFVSTVMGGRTDLPTWKKLAEFESDQLSEELKNLMKPFYA